MSLTCTVAGVDITAGLRYPNPDGNWPSFMLTEAAEKGAVGNGGFQMEDAASAANLPGLKACYWSESNSSNTRLFSGYLADRNIGRGPSMLASTDRQWDVTVVDLNTRFNENIIQSGNRPAETDIARITWLLTVSGFDLKDHGLVDASTTVNMAAQDYTGQYPLDVLNDCSDISGKNFYAYYDDATGDTSLAYFKSDSSLNTSSCSISNVLGAADNITVFAPSRADKMRRDPSRVYSGVFFEGYGFHIYRTNTLNASNFRPRDVRVSNPGVGKISTATYLADQFLARSGSEEDRMLQCHLEPVPDSSVNLIRAGQRIACTFQHISGYTTPTYLRVTRRTVSSLGDGIYALDLELSNPVLTGFTGPVTPPIGGGPPYNPGGDATTASIYDAMTNASMQVRLTACTPTVGAYAFRVAHLDENLPGSAVAGEVWRYAGAITQMDPLALPVSFGVYLVGLQLADILTNPTGQFTIPPGATTPFTLDAHLDYPPGPPPGPPTIPGCFEIDLWRVSP